MTKQKGYILDNKTLDYVEVLPDKAKKIRRFIIFLFISLGLAFVTAHKIPDRLLDVNLLLEEQTHQGLLFSLDSLSLNFKAINTNIDCLYKADSAYFALLEKPVLPSEMLEGGTGGNREKLPLAGEYKSKLLEIMRLSEETEARIKVKTHATSIIETSLEEHKRRLMHTPYIHPIATDDITRWGSGFTNSRLHPILNYFRRHEGLDLIADKGAPVYSPAKGIVDATRRSISFGNIVTISHGYGIKTQYAHLQTFNVETGDSVSRGDTIAFVGSTGLSSGSHLHYEVHIQGNPVDPMNFIHDKLTQEEFELIVREK